MATIASPPNPTALHARDDTPPPIAEPYALFVCAIVEIDDDGRRWTNAGWAKDLAFHLDYLSDITLVSPARTLRETSEDLVPLDRPPFDSLKFVDLPCPEGRWEALKTLPRQVVQYWRAVGGARIVHCGLAGWPIIMGWVALPLAKLRGRYAIANVESSPWRASGAHASAFRRLRGSIGEILSRVTLRMADIKLVTSAAYLRELLPPDCPGAHVTPATWLNEEWILGDEEAVEAWDAKQGPVRMLFAARLIKEKGVSVLFAAIEAAAAAGTDVEFSIIGSGPLRDDCVAFARSVAGKARVSVLDEVAYGDPFLRLLRTYDAVLVPSVSDEQPRIAYDALSQAVPVLGSATGGIAQVVESGVTGRLSPPNDVAGLADSIVWAGRHRADLREMGLRGLASVRKATHQEMHRTRHKLLVEALGNRPGEPKSRT
jgi:glycosyltransferase involved in cell wall biosynthesis